MRIAFSGSSKHALRARHALLGSLGLLPLACGTNTAPGASAADPEHGDPSASATPVTTCATSTPLLSDGILMSTNGTPPQLRAVDTGLQSCESGVIHRPAPVTCQSALPRPVPPASGIDAGAAAMTQVQFLYLYPDNPDYPVDLAKCSADADCNERLFGYCTLLYTGAGGGLAAECSYGCRVDADCGSGALCQCGDPVGQCVPASCRSDEDCGDELCAAWLSFADCGMQHSFACQTAADECATYTDCANGDECVVEGATRHCRPGPGYECGRPFLVQDTARVADLVAGGDWARASVRATEPSDLHERRRVAEHWARAALMEHASIAAFARFALQLLHVGAPRELLEASQRAMQDETEHARLCFGLAARYLGAPVGAGPLPMDGALLELDFERIVVLCFREGCVGETVAALEARVARDHATDPQIQHVLDRIAPDEENHAELAWKFIRWALHENPATTRALLGRELRLLANELSELAVSDVTDLGIAEHGVLAESERSNIRRAALGEIIMPCAEALLGAVCSSDAQPQPGTEPGRRAASA